MLEAHRPEKLSTGDDGMTSSENLQDTIPAVDRIEQALSAQAAILIELFQALRASEVEATNHQATRRQVIKAVETAVHRLA